MKIKATWEVEDIVMGRKYSKRYISEIWIIGWMSGISNEDDRRYCSISLSDGMVTKVYTKEEMVKMLNDSDYIPVEILAKMPKDSDHIPVEIRAKMRKKSKRY